MGCRACVCVRACELPWDEGSWVHMLFISNWLTWVMRQSLVFLSAARLLLGQEGLLRCLGLGQAVELKLRCLQ